MSQENLSMRNLYLAAMWTLTTFSSGISTMATPSNSDLISRAALFGNPVRAQARLSPDGQHISFLAPQDGVLNVWLAPLGQLDAAKLLTRDTKRGVREHSWAPNSTHILYLQDEGGDENWRVYSVDIASGQQLDLTPLKEVQAQIVGVSYKMPDTVLIGLNDRTPEWHDLYAVNVRSGERKLVEKNEAGYAGYLVDLQLQPRLAVKTLEDGGGELYRRDGQSWRKLSSYGQADSLTTQPIVIEADGRSALMVSAVGRDKAALLRLNLETGEQTLIGESAQADVSTVWVEPRSLAPQAYGVEYLYSELSPLTPAAKQDITRLQAALGPQFDVVSRTLDDQKWIVAVDDPQRAATSYLYDRATGKVDKLFAQRPELADAPTQPMWAREIKTRDGYTMVAYLTLPIHSDSNNDGVPDKPVPLVLNVHGGPWARDSFGFDPEHQWLANRGYAVLSVNYRGSTGFGKQFINAADGEWAGKMHDDLIDAVQWAVQQKIAAADKVAIYGGSYGGYATLVGLTFTPEAFACGVDIVGPSNLATLLASIPPYWKAFFEDMAKRIGDPRTAEGRKLLAERSPLTHVAKIKRPLLIAQGANDPRVKQAEADQIVASMRERQLPVTYALYPDEGHGFARPQNRLSFYAVAEGFLAQCLGGRQEAIGNDFAGASLQVNEGAQHIPGLPEALRVLQRSPEARKQIPKTPSPQTSE
jgi:dipeptidyl aminopeptidase/acylaminoacyl peptidase